MDRFFLDLRKKFRFEVRLGNLAPRPGGPIQKGVDTKIVLDLVALGTKHVITHAMLITGDKDLAPAVEVARHEGVVVTLFCAALPTMPRQALLDSPDRLVQIDRSLIKTRIRLPSEICECSSGYEPIQRDALPTTHPPINLKKFTAFPAPPDPTLVFRFIPPSVP